MKELCTCTTATSSIKGVMAGMLAVTTGLILASAAMADGKNPGTPQGGSTTGRATAPATPWSNVGPQTRHNTTLQKGAPLQKVWGPPIPPSGIAGAPANDNCASAMAIFDGATAVDTTGASTDGPPHTTCGFCCGDNQINQDIWFDYSASQSGSLIVSMCGSTYDTKVGVYDGCGCPVGDGNLLACNDDFCGLQSQTSATVTAGNCYKIRVGGFGTAFGSGTVNLSYGAGGPPANDNCVDRIEIFLGDTPFTTELATTDGPTTACNGFGDPQVNQDIWYNFNVLISDVYTVNTCGSAFDTKIAIYDGCVCPPGAEIGCNDDAPFGPCAGTLQSAATFDGVAGQCYKIRVGGFLTASGTGNINISQGAPPPVCGDPNNHDCCTTGGPGCSDEKCCNAVCAVDPFCCAVSWDGICVSEAGVICGNCGATVFCPPPTFPQCPNPEHDCLTTGTPGCSDEACCNTVCAADSFCCNTSWDGICVSEAQAMCGGGGSSCPQVSCPPGGVPEGEPCCDDTNGGCNSVPPIFTNLLCGQTVCAVQWAFGNIRDTDWYTFETGGGLVTWTVDAEFPSIAFLASNCCPPTILAQGAAGCNSVASADLPPGSYLAIEVPASFTGLACGGTNNDYTGHLECTPPCIGDITGDGLVNTADLLQVINHWGPCP